MEASHASIYGQVEGRADRTVVLRTRTSATWWEEGGMKRGEGNQNQLRRKRREGVTGMSLDSGGMSSYCSLVFTMYDKIENHE
jgi:hypothetical protein